MSLVHQTSENFESANRAFLFGDAVKVSFFVRESRLILAEDCYFFLMASMRKMRMNIPLEYTLEFFQNLFSGYISNHGFQHGIITFMVYRNVDSVDLSKANVSFYYDFKEMNDVLQVQRNFEIDLIKEITVNTNLLSNIRVHSAENVYAGIYSAENDLNDVILLNPFKRIARTIYGNLLLLQGNTLRVVKQSEGALISPLMESFITFVHKNNLAEIHQEEMVAFETQKADEILLISDEIGIYNIIKIRNKTFLTNRFEEMIDKWSSSFMLD